MIRPALRPIALALTIGALFALGGCNRVGLLNALTIDERGGERVAHGVQYGDGPRRSLDVYAPRADGEDRPVLVFIHGGGWSWGRREDYSFVGRAFAARGFVTVIANYRLTPDVAFPAFLEDVASAIAWTQANAGAYGGDATRIYLSGHSAGAYNVVQVALDPRYLEAAGVAPETIAGVAGISGPYDFLPLDSESTRAAFAAADDLDTTQPINFARADAPPMLLISGRDDTSVPPRHTDALAARLEEAGAEVETRYYDGADHGETLMAISPTFRGRAPVLDDIAAFFLDLHARND